VNILNEQSQTAGKGWSSSLGLRSVTKCYVRPRNWKDYFKVASAKKNGYKRVVCYGLESSEM
jgi:hypothetical protein